jgi:hypothetical protein
VEYDFQATLGINLREEFRRMPWRRFTVLVAGLLAGETMLRARFHPLKNDDDAGTLPATFD